MLNSQDGFIYFANRKAIDAGIMNLCRLFIEDESFPDEVKSEVIERLISFGPEKLLSRFDELASPAELKAAESAAEDVGEMVLAGHSSMSPKSLEGQKVEVCADQMRRRMREAVIIRLPRVPTTMVEEIVARVASRYEAQINELLLGGEPRSVDSVGPFSNKPRYGDLPLGNRPECESFLIEHYQEDIERGLVARTSLREYDYPLYDALRGKYKADPASFDRILPRKYKSVLA